MRVSPSSGSGLFKKPPKWVMVAELVETSRLWGRIAAKIEPEWIEPLAPHLVKYHYSEPHWEKSQGAVMATEKVTLYGLPVVAGRPVNYGNIDPALCRELFIRHALVEGDWLTRHAFFRKTRNCVTKWKSWNTNPGAAISLWMMKLCSVSTIPVCRRILSRHATLITGGNGNGCRNRIFSIMRKTC